MSEKKWIRNLKNAVANIDRKRFLRFLLAAVFCVLIITLCYQGAFRLIRQIRLKAQQNEIMRSATVIDYQLKESVDAVQIAAYTMHSMMNEGADAEQLCAYLENQTEIFSNSIDENFDGLYGLFDDEYLDGAGWVPPEGYEAKERPWYQEAMKAKGSVALVTPYLDVESDRMIISISCMLPDRKSVVALDLFLDQIQKQVEKDTARNDWDLCMIIDNEGTIVAHSDPSKRGQNLSDTPADLHAKIGTKVLLQPSDMEEVIRVKGRNYWIFSSPVENNWHTVAVMNERKMVGGLRYYYVLNILTIVLALGILFVILYRDEQERQETDEVRRQLMAIANIYSYVYLIDLKEDTYMRISDNSQMQQVVTGREGAQNTMRAVLDSMTDARFKSMIYEFTNFSTLDERLSDKDTIVKEFIDNRNRRCRGRFVVVDRDDDGTITHVIWLVGCEEMKGGVRLV